MLFSFLFFMQVISVCLSFDLQLEGAVHFGKDLLRRISNDLLPRSKIWGPPQPRSAYQLMSAEPSNSPIQRSDIKKDDLKKEDKIPEAKIFQMVTEKGQEMAASTENPVKITNDNFQFNLTHRLSKNGVLKLKTLADFFKTHMNNKLDIDSELKDATKNYLAAMNEYYEFISKKIVRSDIDKQFVVLDMIETANQILMNEAKKLLDALIKNPRVSKLQIDTQEMMEKIKSIVLEEKMEELRYVCKVLDVCRAFPGYSDRIAELLSELLQLPDKKFQTIIMTLNETVTVKSYFFKTILRDNVYDKLSTKLEKSLDNVPFMREIFSVIRSVITQKFKIFKSDSLEMKIKTKALRILLDIIDKAFDINDDEVNYIDIDNTISSYKEWATGGRDDVKMITKKFIYNAIEIFNYYWGKETREEVKVLTEVIYAGETKNIEVYDYLFTKGSILIRDFS